MTSKNILEAMRSVFTEDPFWVSQIFGTNELPIEIENTVLTISSLDLVDFLICLEDKINKEIDGDIIEPHLTLGKLAERIANNV